MTGTVHAVSDGASHTHGRSSVGIVPEQATEVARALRDHGVPAVVVATCYRFEVYWTGVRQQADVVRRTIQQHAQLSATPLADVRSDEDAVEHLMAVASGIRSQRRGEPEILGQMRLAWHAAHTQQATDRLLDDLWQRAISAARHIRRHLGSGATTTIGTDAMSLISRELDTGTIAPEPHMLLVLGAGAVGASVAQSAHLAKRSGQLPQQLAVRIANRTDARAASLAADVDATAIAWHAWHDALAEADIVICAARSYDPIISASDACRALSRRTHRTLWIDLAAPGNIAPDASHVHLTKRSLSDLRGAITPGDSFSEAAERALADEMERYRSDRRRRSQYAMEIGASTGAPAGASAEYIPQH